MRRERGSEKGTKGGEGEEDRVGKRAYDVMFHIIMLGDVMSRDVLLRFRMVCSRFQFGLRFNLVRPLLKMWAIFCLCCACIFVSD